MDIHTKSLLNPSINTLNFKRLKYLKIHILLAPVPDGLSSPSPFCASDFGLFYSYIRWCVMWKLGFAVRKLTSSESRVGVKSFLSCFLSWIWICGELSYHPVYLLCVQKGKFYWRIHYTIAILGSGKNNNNNYKDFYVLITLVYWI